MSSIFICHQEYWYDNHTREVGLVTTDEAAARAWVDKFKVVKDDADYETYEWRSYTEYKIGKRYDKKSEYGDDFDIDEPSPKYTQNKE